MIPKILAGRIPPHFIPHPGGKHERGSSLKILSRHFNLKQVKAVVFDIDGTLYSLPDGPFVKRYMELVQARMEPGQYAALKAEWGKAGAGRSVFKSGRVYDSNLKKVLVLDNEGKVAEAFELWGGSVPKHDIRGYYPEGVKPGEPGFVFMEGGPWVLTGMARSFGISLEENEKIYQQIYAEISKDPKKYFDSPSPPLMRFFSRLHEKNCKIAVMSNTPEPMASLILKTLGVADKVDLFIPAAGKPLGSRERLQGILSAFGLKPRQVVSVGDSVGNDLDVPRQMGMQTVLLEDFPVQTEKSADAKGKDIQALAQAFEESWEEAAA